MLRTGMFNLWSFSMDSIWQTRKFRSFKEGNWIVCNCSIIYFSLLLSEYWCRYIEAWSQCSTKKSGKKYVSCCGGTIGCRLQFCNKILKLIILLFKDERRCSFIPSYWLFWWNFMRGYIIFNKNNLLYQKWNHYRTTENLNRECNYQKNLDRCYLITYYKSNVLHRLNISEEIELFIKILM